jgi:hypothetical protein
MSRQQSWPVINQKGATASLLGKSGTMFLFSTILPQDLCWL